MGWEDYSDNIIKIQLRNIDTWSNNEFLDEEERSVIKNHFAGLLFRYKEIINTIVDSKPSLEEFKKHYAKYNDTLKVPLDEYQVKELFWKKELSITIKENIEWIKEFTGQFSGASPIRLENMDKEDNNG